MLYFVIYSAYDVYNDGTNNFIETLSSSHFSALIGIIIIYLDECFISNKKMNYPISFLYYTNTGNSVFYSSPGYVPHYKYVSSFLDMNKIYFCDLDSELIEREQNTITLGFIYVSSEISKSYLINYRLAFRSILSFLQVNNSKIFINVIDIDYSKFDDIESVFIYLHKNKITHIIGGFFRVILNKFIELLSSNNIMFWYISNHPSDPICNSNVYII